MNKTIKQVEVKLPLEPYKILIGSNLLNDSSLFAEYVSGKKVLILSQKSIANANHTTGTSNLEYLTTSLTLAGASVDHLLVQDGENAKSIEVANQIYTKLIADLYDRKSVLVALGGGVVGDLGGYIAATFQRGIDFIQVPTTLLSMVDSSIGGKTGINHPLGKNLIGAFKQPKIVIVDINFLNTLPERELKSGLSEVIKYGILFDRQFFDYLIENRELILARDLNVLSYIIQKCCEFKAQVVINDEKEQGERALLNLGHTFGHAIENYLGYGEWAHGEAVSSGIVIAAHYSAKYGNLTNKEAQLIQETIKSFGLNYWIPAQMDATNFIYLMLRDKKSISKQLNLILIDRIGHCYIAKNQDQNNISDIINTHKIQFTY